MSFINLIASLPNFKGKLAVGNWVYGKFGKETDNTIATMPGFKMDLNLHDRIQRCMYLRKSHEPETEAVMLEFIKKYSGFYDIGANIGFFTLFALGNNPNIKTVSFEPFPGNVKRLKNNLSINPGFNERAIVEELCVNDEKCEVEFIVPPEDECGWGRIPSEEDAKGKELIKRNCVTLDEYVETCDVVPEFVKIDVEGNETNVLKGAATCFEKGLIKVLCVELNEISLVDRGTSSIEVINKLKSLGYQAHVVKNAVLMAVDGPIDDYPEFNYFFIRS